MGIHRFLIAALVSVIAVGAFAADDEKEKEEERTEIRQMVQDTLTRLYKAQPAAKAAVEKGYGYAVFSNTGVKILLAGLGIGVKKFRVVFVFDNQKAFDNFVNSGWEFGGQTSAAAKTSPEKGGSMEGAASVSEGVWMYQLTDKGLALEITAKGTKYSKDDDLNNKS